jgi:apolipoprotein N-acyltransferase
MTRYLRVKWAWKATAAIALVCFLAAFTVMIALAPYDWAWLVGPGL